MRKPKPSAIELAARVAFARAYYTFKEDTVKRCKNRADMVVALQELKRDVAERIRKTGAPGWEDIIKAAEARCDAAIKALTSDQPAATRKAALAPAPDTKPRLILLPETRRKMRPPQSN